MRVYALPWPRSHASLSRPRLTLGHCGDKNKHGTIRKWEADSPQLCLRFPDPGHLSESLPHSVVADQVQVVEWEPDDIANDDLCGYLAARRMPFAEFLKRERPYMVAIMKDLPARQVEINGTSLKYVVVAIGGTVEQLEGITGYRPSGRTAMEIFQSEVTPHFA